MPEVSLEEALRQREAVPERALQAIEATPEAVDLDDAELFRWVAGQCRPKVTAGLQPLFQRALTVEGEVRRIALQKLGATAWYEGRLSEAEAHWSRGVQEGRALRDDLWRMGLNNLSLIQLIQGRHFEALVLSGAVLRHGPSEPDAIADFAHSFRARALLELDLQEAHRVLEAVFARESVFAAPPTLHGALGSLRSTYVDVLCASGRWEQAEERARVLAESDMEGIPDAHRLSLRLKVLRTQYELRPSERATRIEELDALEQGLEVEGDWRTHWERSRHLLRWRFAAERQQLAEAEAEATGFFESWAQAYSSEGLDEAIGLLEAYPLSPTTRANLLGRAADVVLQRFDEGEQTRERAQESEEATREDWRLFARYQSRLLQAHLPLRAHFASRWKPGLPAYDRFARRGLVAQCAWCGRLEAEEGWVPAEDLTKLVEPSWISHGICPPCRAQIWS